MRNDEVSFKNKIEIISSPRSVIAIGVVVAQIVAYQRVNGR